MNLIEQKWISLYFKKVKSKMPLNNILELNLLLNQIWRISLSFIWFANILTFWKPFWKFLSTHCSLHQFNHCKKAWEVIYTVIHVQQFQLNLATECVKMPTLLINYSNVVVWHHRCIFTLNKLFHRIQHGNTWKLGLNWQFFFSFLHFLADCLSHVQIL